MSTHCYNHVTQVVIEKFKMSCTRLCTSEFRIDIYMYQLSFRSLVTSISETVFFAIYNNLPLKSRETSIYVFVYICTNNNWTCPKSEFENIYTRVEISPNIYTVDIFLRKKRDCNSGFFSILSRGTHGRNDGFYLEVNFWNHLFDFDAHEIVRLDLKLPSSCRFIYGECMWWRKKKSTNFILHGKSIKIILLYNCLGEK